MEERKGEIQREEQKPKKIVIKPTLGEELPQVSGIPKRPPETGEAEGIEEEGGEVEEVTELEEEELGEQHRASMRLLREKGAAVIVDERLRKLNLPFPTVSSLSSVVRRVRRFIGGE
ncbi:MAG: hypothetical protein GWN86_22955 [Desulfobacterales bacterium]|nr:hypothetical protein [Desulfobacterales bacterium]